MLNNLKIGVRLGVGFAITLLLLITIAVVSYMRLGALNTEIENLVNDKYPKTIDAIDVIRAMNQVAIINRNLLLNSDPTEVQNQFNAQTEQRKIITDNIKRLEDTIKSEAGKKVLGVMISERKEYTSDLEKFIALIQAKDRDSAQKLLTGPMVKSTQEYLGSIRKLIDFQDELMKKAGKDADDLVLATERLIIILGSIAAVLTALFGWFITRSITGPTAKMVDGANKMAAGDFNFKLDIDSKDEIGQLASAVGSMQAAVQAMIADAAMLAQAATAGKLETRADATKHKGDFHRIVSGVNNTLDAVIGPLNVAAGYVDRISKGDIPPKITDTYNGDFNTLKNNLNQAITSINALVSDANMLAKAAVEGKLETRADAAKHQGDFQKIVVGVNNTLDAVINPLNVAAGYVDRISKGDIPPKITDNYNGDFNTLKNNLNTCVDSVNALVADANMLAQAAVAGKLETRANAAKHQGDFQKIVQGVNNTLDAVIGPLNVTARYVDDISKGVIPPIITDNYNGDFNVIKSNLNNVVKMMSDLLAQTDIIIKGAADGELDKRANAEMFVGGWNKLVTGVNQAITNIVNPMNVTADYVDKVSKGIIPPTITAEYRGQYNIIKNNLNNMVKMMNDLLAQTDIIIKGAADGELDKRANAELFVGGWNQLVKGVNEVVTNIVNPLNVTADYVDRIAKGDIPPPITAVYKGQYNIIKGNLNACIEATNQQAMAAKQISMGDLTANVKIRSENDVMAKSLIDVVKAVNALVTDANRLSEATVDGR
ncbi:MAG: MCP four helix bundle domain-containing protein, partial [Rhodoferax sp.]|nr:MCP four helix bundle domain-containing protein [Rhodoferax sp.]